MTGNIGIAEFFSEAIELCRECLWQVIAFVCILTAGSVATELVFEDPTILAGFELLELTAAGVAALLAYALFYYLLTYALVVAMLRRRGESPDVGPRLVPYIGLSLVVMIGVLLGLILIIVPGLIFLTRWAASPGYVVARRMGIIDSMRASWELSSGRGWHIFAGLMFITVGGGILSGILDGTMLGVSGREGIVVSALSLLISNASGALSTAYGIAVFTLLDRNTNQMADVFA